MSLVSQVDELIRRTFNKNPDAAMELRMNEVTLDLFVKDIMDNYWFTREGMSGYGEMNERPYYRGIPIITDDTVKKGMISFRPTQNRP